MLEQIEAEFSEVSVGSYPFFRNKKFGASFVLRSQLEADLDQAVEALQLKIAASGRGCFAGEAL